MSVAHTPIAIVGGGPVGMTLANLLGVYGVSAVVLERNPGTVEEPRAIAIDAESLRTMQAAGLYDAIAEDILLGFHVDYVNGAGRTLFGVDLAETPYGHAQQNSFDQPILERQLLAGLRRFAHIEMRFGHMVEGFTQTADGVVLHGRAAAGERFQLRADYLVGCDGGRSSVRQAVGISMLGQTAPQKWLVIDTFDPDLADTLECRFFCDPARPGMTLRKKHQMRRWEWMLLPGETDEQLLDDALIRSLIAPYTRPEQVRIQRKCVYTFHSLVAERYRVARVLLAGDAAHMMPPFAGQGMNGGIRDARNLAWKLALVVQGRASPRILDSYEVERRDHVIAATRLANRLAGFIQPASRWRALMRDLFFAAVHLTPLTRRAFERSLMSGIRVPRLEAGLFVPAADGSGPPLAGQFLAQPLVRTAAGATVRLDEALGPGFALLGYDRDPEKLLNEAARNLWQELGAHIVCINPAGVQASGDAVEDVSGALAAWFGARTDRIAVIRPDRFCAAELQVGSAEATTAVFRSLLRE